MKANELMMGDYVRTNKKVEDEYYFDEYQPGEIVKVKEILDNGINPDWCGAEINSILNIDAIEPIPLTAEILEANGWEKVPQPGCANPYHWELSKYDDDKEDDAYLLYRVKAYETFFRGMLVSISRPSCEDISFRKQVEHVHELQHALRLCDIEKEIIIKKED